MGFYHTAQVCKNGHWINLKADTKPEHNKNFCSLCGAETISACPSCSAKIHGRYEEPNVLYGNFHPPVDKYCYNCGKPYPWTQSALLAATALIYEEENLSDDLKDQTVASLNDIITETPQTTLAAVRLKKCLSSVGKFTADGIRQFAVDFGCELARKILGL